MAIEAIEGPPDGKGKEVQPSNTKVGQQFKANSSQTTAQGQAQLTDEEIQRLQQQEELFRQQKLAELEAQLAKFRREPSQMPDGKSNQVLKPSYSNTQGGQQFKANSSQTTGQGQAQLTDEEIQRLQQQEELSRQQKLAELREELRQMAGADTSAGQQTAQQEAAAQAERAPVPAPEQGEEYGMIL